MVPKFVNPHSLSQDAEITTRSNIAERAGLVSIIQDEHTRLLERDLDNLLQNIWVESLVELSNSSKAKKHRKMSESYTNKDDRLAFRLVSSMKYPQHISLDLKPPPSFMPIGPDCEDDEMQGEVRRIRALSVVMESEDTTAAVLSKRDVVPKRVTLNTKAPVANASPLPLPSLLVTEEGRSINTIRRFATRTSEAAASPHEPHPSCYVLPVTSVLDRKETAGRKKRRKIVKERPPPAYWRPSSDLQGKCIGYALGYPTNWAPDQLYVRDVMKRGVESALTCHAVHYDTS